MGRLPLALTLPTDGAASTRRTLGRVLKKVARDTLRLHPSLVGADASRPLATAQDRVRLLGQEDRRALFAVLRRPHVHVHLSCTLRALEEKQGALASERARGYLFQLLVDLALDGLLPERVEWPGLPPLGRVSSPPHRVSAAAEGPVTFGPGGVTVAGHPARRGGPSDRFESVAPGIVLALEDLNPVSDFEAHPDKEGNRLDLGEASAGTWAGTLGDSLGLIGRHLPALREEMDRLLQVFVPVGTDDERHLSASYREAIGLVYLTHHPRLMTMAEAVVHEYQHNKLNMLFRLDPVMHNAYWPLYPSPVRPDPRPLHGVLLAAHAFVPVAELYRALADAGAPEASSGGFSERFGAIIQMNDEAMTVLEVHAQPTEAGAEVLDSLSTLHREHLALDV